MYACTCNVQAWYEWHLPEHARLTGSDLDDRSSTSDDARRGEDSANKDSGAGLANTGCLMHARLLCTA